MRQKVFFDCHQRFTVCIAIMVCCSRSSHCCQIETFIVIKLFEDTTSGIDICLTLHPLGVPINIKIHHYTHNQARAVCGFKCSLWTHSHWIHCPGFCVVLFLALNSNTRFSRTFSELRHKKRMFTYGICHPREQISQCVWYTTRKGIFKDLGTKIFCGALKQSKKALAASSLRVYIPCAVNLDWGTELVFWRKTNSKPLPDLKGVY